MSPTVLVELELEEIEALHPDFEEVAEGAEESAWAKLQAALSSQHQGEVEGLREALSKWHEFGLVEAAAERAYADAGDHPRAMAAAVEAAIAEGLRQFDESAAPSDSQGEGERCGGSGIVQIQVERIEPDCCGNVNSAGECRGDCAVPRQVLDTDHRICPGCPDCDPASTQGGDEVERRERAVDELLELAKLADDEGMRTELERLASRFSLPPVSTHVAEAGAGDGSRLDKDPEVRKFCPLHGERDQCGIYCNQPMGTRLACGKELRIEEQGEGGGEEDWPEDAVKSLWKRLPADAGITLDDVAFALDAIPAPQDPSALEEWKAAADKATDLADKASRLGLERTAQRDKAWTAFEELAAEFERRADAINTRVGTSMLTERVWTEAATLCRERAAEVKGGGQ